MVQWIDDRKTISKVGTIFDIAISIPTILNWSEQSNSVFVLYFQHQKEKNLFEKFLKLVIDFL